MVGYRKRVKVSKGKSFFIFYEFLILFDFTKKWKSGVLLSDFKGRLLKFLNGNK